MKKSNIVVFTIAAVVSVFLLGLWFFLGFNQIDSPLDLVVSVIWWVAIVVSVLAIGKVESNRREKIRWGTASCSTARAALWLLPLACPSWTASKTSSRTWTTVLRCRTFLRKASSSLACWSVLLSTRAKSRRTHLSLTGACKTR